MCEEQPHKEASCVTTLADGSVVTGGSDKILVSFLFFSPGLFGFSHVCPNILSSFLRFIGVKLMKSFKLPFPLSLPPSLPATIAALHVTNVLNPFSILPPSRPIFSLKSTHLPSMPLSFLP